MDRTEQDRAPIYIADGVVTASQFHPVCTTAQIDIVLDDDAVQTFFVGDAISCRDIAIEFLVAATRFDNATPQVECVEHSVDLEDLAHTIRDHFAAFAEWKDDGALVARIFHALKDEFAGQSLHMREDEATQ
jgi:hypothetical protein